HRGYYIRARAVDHCIRDFLLETQSHQRTQILSLGAGFDSLFFRLKDLGLLHRTVVYEVDFPGVARQKAALIRRTEELSALVGDPGAEGPGMVSTGGAGCSEEANVAPTFQRCCISHGAGGPSVVEFLLRTLPGRSDAVIQWAAERFSKPCFLLYEQMHPEDPFGHVMQRHFSRMNSALRSLAPYPDREAQQRRFLGKGWTACSIVDMNEFFTCCTPEEEQRRVQALEPFDEYEEWHLKCSHYFILAASKGMEPPWTPLMPRLTAPPGEGPVGAAGVVPAAACAGCSDTLGLRRYGHRSVLLKPNVVLTSGGFGEEDGQHGRVRSLHVLEKRGGRWKTAWVGKENPDTRWGELWQRFSWLRQFPSWVTFPCSMIFQTLTCPFPWLSFSTGEEYLFLYGGRSAKDPVLGDWCFLHIPELSSAAVPVEGAVPERRHSHGACGWEGGAVIAGGLGAAEKPLGSIFLLKEVDHGFRWQPVETHPPLVPRYSHTAHAHGGKLLLVGGVWLHSSSVPGVTVVDLKTGLCLDYTIDADHLEWPLMLHNHSSVLLPEEQELLVTGGGGNCFSFGTHLNPEPVSLSLSTILTGP
ncbi:TYW4 protein, partial [Crotophaga sulcirostris]|nr:TYW4 protein [Crotophaga sulcirostris]